MSRFLLFLAVGAILAASCEGGDPPLVGAPAPLATEATFANGGECPDARDPSLPVRTGCVSVVRRGGATFQVFARLDRDHRPESWWMRLIEGDEQIDRRLDAGNVSSYPRAVGVTDLNGDGRVEWWVKVADFTSHGAPWSQMNLFVRDQETLTNVQLDGAPLGVNYGGIARLGEGASCSDGNIVLLRAEARDRRNTRWRTIERTVSVEGDRATLVHRSEGVLVIEDYNDPALDAYYRIDCAGFVYPG